MAYVEIGRLSVAEQLRDFVESALLPGLDLPAHTFWSGLDELIHDLAPRNRDLLARRVELQARLDAYHRTHPGPPDTAHYQAFLDDLGYLVPEPGDVQITTGQVDSEISSVAGPQLIVPILNARYAVNAVNARWGSLYDAFYGTDAIDDTAPGRRPGGYDPARGAEVVARSRDFLDAHFPLAAGSHRAATSYGVDGGRLVVECPQGPTTLADPAQFVGYVGDREAPSRLLLVHHGLHVEIVIDRSTEVGASDPAGVTDMVLESAVTTIMDLEDSVAAVDAGDKVRAYQNWLLLMQGGLSEKVTKDGRTFTRAMNPDRRYTGAAGGSVTLPGRALLLVRHVGLLMTTDAVLDVDRAPTPEGILDAWVTAVCSLYDLRGLTKRQNSRTQSMYVVKPKLHGPDEVAFTCELFGRIEASLGLRPGTIKLGIMDEERRTSANLQACIFKARDRVAFINTGFLDRTGDEIHTSMHAGPMIRKADMRGQAWIKEYERSNVAVGLAAGFLGRAQIGKGMWAAPDNMADMLREKVGHPQAGASCAWVPSPTAATLHVLHYHQVDVHERQRGLRGAPGTDRAQILRIPLGDPTVWSAQDVRDELDNNVQGVLGYVVRWIDAGVGCSKVPDLGGTPLMEDRATCRISSQHVANWLLHGVVTPDQVEESLRRMALLVDEQNAGDPGYQPMGPHYDGEAFLAARELLLEGIQQPSGYTEPVLHRWRVRRKHVISGAAR